MEENRKVILVVDDSSANLQLCKGLLSGEYDVRLAKSGKMALAALARVRPDVILLDIEMPDMTGFEVMGEIKENLELKNIPVIFVTSHASEKLIDKAVGNGAADYLVKPFVSDLLLSKISNVLQTVS
ncbi:MAG: response regulator [Synergistaceae bacterium]|nr:response regulator [Synergistaceae bacterium]